jgi:hypothetical protein
MRGLRLLTVAVALLAAGVGTSPPVGAQAARIDRMEPVDHGTFQLQVGPREAAPGTATGWITVGQAATLLDGTGRVPARLGVSFGVRFRVGGPRVGEIVRLNAIWHFPEPGLKNPGTGNVYRQQTTEIEVGSGTINGTFYRLDEAWELLPGTWVIEIREGDRKLLEQAFTVYQP